MEKIVNLEQRGKKGLMQYLLMNCNHRRILSPINFSENRKIRSEISCSSLNTYILFADLRGAVSANHCLLVNSK